MFISQLRRKQKKPEWKGEKKRQLNKSEVKWRKKCVKQTNLDVKSVMKEIKTIEEKVVQLKWLTAYALWFDLFGFGQFVWFHVDAFENHFRPPNFPRQKSICVSFAESAICAGNRKCDNSPLVRSKTNRDEWDSDRVIKKSIIGFSLKTIATFLAASPTIINALPVDVWLMKCRCSD